METINSVVSVLHDNPTWHCGRCTLEIIDDEQSTIVCDSCLAWYHFACVGLKKNHPKAEYGCAAHVMRKLMAYIANII